MNTTTKGRAVEEAVARHLEQKGYSLVSQNWKTAWCEIDLIMTKHKTVYFIEVKFRSSHEQGVGFEYVTPKKLAQMHKAAESWMHMEGYAGDARLMAASVDGASSTIRVVEI